MYIRSCMSVQIYMANVKNEQINEKVVYFVLMFLDFQDQIFFASQSECGRQHTSVSVA